MESSQVADADIDADADGLTNRQEFLAGTHPNDSENGLKLRAIVIEFRWIGMQFQAIAHRSYTVLYREAIPSGEWRKLADIPRQTRTRWETVTDIIEPAKARFYRVITPGIAAPSLEPLLP